MSSMKNVTMGPDQILISLSSNMVVTWSKHGPDMVPTIGNSFGMSFGPFQLSPESFKALVGLDHTFPDGDGAGAGVQIRF